MCNIIVVFLRLLISFKHSASPEASLHDRVSRSPSSASSSPPRPAPRRITRASYRQPQSRSSKSNDTIPSTPELVNGPESPRAESPPATPPPYDPHSGKSIKGPFNDKFINGHWEIQYTPARILHDNPPPVFRTEYIPHALQDRINLLDDSYRESEHAREVFEAMMRNVTTVDDPNGPPIRIVNEVDDESTPPWEFHYSNRLWHGEGVPDPDLENLQGCSCTGICDPKSTTCVCVKKQARFHDEGKFGGFAYDEKNRLHKNSFEHPIFECNDLCGCTEACRNRVSTFHRISLSIVQRARLLGCAAWS